MKVSLWCLPDRHLVGVKQRYGAIAALHETYTSALLSTAIVQPESKATVLSKGQPDPLFAACIV